MAQGKDKRGDPPDYWEKAFQAVSESISIVDEEQTILDCNEAFAGLVGLTPKEVIGRKCYQLVHGLDQPPEECIACKAFEQQKSVNMEFHEAYLDKEIYASADPFADAEGSRMALHLIRDITDQKRASELLRQQRDFTQVILDSIPNPVYYRDSDFRYTGCNTAFEAYLGRTRDEIVGKTTFDIYPEPIARSYHDKDVELFEHPGEQTYETRVRYADGSDHDVIFNKATYTNPDGTVGGLVGVIVDITERKRVEEQMRITQFEVDRAGDMIIRVDLDGRILYANESACAEYGYGGNEMLTLTMYDIAPDLVEGQWGRTISEAFLSDATLRREVRHRRKDGTLFPVEITATFLEFDGTRHVVIYGRDITERKQAEETLKRVNAELHGYAHTVSHDLRGPIATIMLASDTLHSVFGPDNAGTEEGDLDAEEVTAIIGRAASKANRLISDLLSLAEAGQVPRDITDVDVGGVIRNVIEEKAGDIEERGFEVTVDEDMGTVRANETQVYQVFANLLSNAIKHNTSEKPTIAVRNLGDTDIGRHNYLVCDNGPGIAADSLEQIFIPFVKGAGTGDTGIGLSTVEKIVKLYGGKIRAYNDNGACFEFSLLDY